MRQGMTGIEIYSMFTDDSTEDKVHDKQVEGEYS
jgi:hypothetical protein